MKVKLKQVNDLIISDDCVSVFVIKKPKRRYRTIIRSYYRKRRKV